MFDLTFLGWRTIAKRLIFWFLLIGFVPILTLTVLVYLTMVNGLTEEMERGIVALADTKAEQLETYARDMERNVVRWAETADWIDALKKLKAAYSAGGSKSPAYSELERSLRPLIVSLIEGRCYDFILISESGELIFRVRQEEDFDTNLETGPYRDSSLAQVFEQVKSSRQPAISDFRYYPPSDAPALFVAAPVWQDGQLIGVLAAQLSSAEIYPLIGGLSGLGQTGEIVLAAAEDGEAVVVAPLRSDPAAAFNVRIPLGSNHHLPLEAAGAGMDGAGGGA